ncbi:MAG TPA: methionine adenosyltransferase [Candidatus Limiplasma sp.]|nr:methionine adenosyltransferase [Candidatus Limiplasma sp.]
MDKDLRTAESVCAGHPDKLCDQIADRILDECLRSDTHSRVACEVMATKGRIIIAGEISCAGKSNVRSIVRSVLSDVGYEPFDFKVQVYLHRQSPDISAGVSQSLEVRAGSDDDSKAIGAGDQGTMYGYATNETHEMLPLPVVLAHRICKRVDEVRQNGILRGSLPDGKAQVTIEYEDDQPKRVQAVVVSVQHTSEKDLRALKQEIYFQVLLPCFEAFPMDDDTEVLINPSGRFVEGGPAADTGLTGRKLMVDTYGGLALQGGGALSGKDATKVDRTGAYMARYIAKHVVACGLASRCQVNLCYAIGKAVPVAVRVDTFGSETIPKHMIDHAVLNSFPLSPSGMIDLLQLRRPIYAPTAVYGHFTNPNYPWEQLDRCAVLESAVKKIQEHYSN